nr:CCA tRNA nucleotidyltransferase [uncultured Sulfurimonas sp.]
MFEYPNFLNKIFDKLINNSAIPIIIGGYVRDYLLDITSDDIDIEVYNISSFEKLENLLKEFGTISNVGKSFGVCKLKFQNLVLDFTLPRIDSKVASGHSGFNIVINKNLDFLTATRRRDFTINAIAYNVVEKKLLDPFNGINDLKNKTLKMIDAKSFVEDPLRILRAVQFCSRYDLKMDKKLFLICKDMVNKNLFSQLAKERIYEELKKNLLKSKKPSIGFKLLKELDAIKYFTNLNLLNKEDWHRSMNAIDAIAKLNITNKKKKEILMLASISYKFDTTQIESFISCLSNDKYLLKNIITLCKNLNTITNISSKKINNYDIFKLSTMVNIEDLSILSDALFGIGKDVAFRAKELKVLNKKVEAILLGRDLISFGLKPSSEFSHILKSAYEAQMHGEFSSLDEAKKWLNIFLTNSQ